MAKAEKKKPAAFALPDGYDDEKAFLLEATTFFQAGIDVDRENRDQAVEDLKFAAGEQWDALATTARKGRPCLTINQQPQFIAQVVGDIRLNRPAIRVRPVEDADKDLADVREGLIRFIERDNDAQGVYVNTAQNQVACGIGNFRIGLKYASGLSFDRDITMAAIPNAFAVVWDAMSVERTGRDARHCFVVDVMNRKDFEAQFKDAIDSGLTVPMYDANGWYTSDTVRVTEYWSMQSRKVKIALLEGGQVVKVEDVPEGQMPIAEREADEIYACMYLITSTAILAGPFELPIDRVPIIRAEGWVMNIGDRRVRWGLVRFAKDPQRLKNYWRSVSAEVIALAPKAKWLLHESNEGDQEEFRNAHRSDDAILTYTGAVKPELVNPAQINSAVLNESAMCAQDMKDVTGLHDASLGIKSNETSGKAINARQREGDVASYIYPDNLNAAIKEGGRIINDLIPPVFDTVRSIRILGEDEALKVQKINDPNDPDSIDMNRGRYDVALDTGPSYSTKRQESSEAMMQLVQSVPQVGQVAGDLIVRSLDINMADKIADRLVKALPPQLQDKDEDGEAKPPTPEEQAAAQAQQQQAQMAQKAATLELEGKEADVAKANADAKKAVADAHKAEADAIKAQFETGHLIGREGLDLDGDGEIDTLAANNNDEATEFGQAVTAPDAPATVEAPTAA